MYYCVVVCCALLCSRFNDNIHTRTNYCCTAVVVYPYSGSARYARSQRSMDWKDRYILGANRRLANAKSSMLQESKRQHACTYLINLIRTVIGTYLVCCFVQGGLRCAVLCSRFNDIHTHPHILLRYCCLLLYTYGYRKRKRWKLNGK